MSWKLTPSGERLRRIEFGKVAHNLYVIDWHTFFNRNHGLIYGNRNNQTLIYGDRNNQV